MSDISLSALAEPLLSAVRAVWPHFRCLHAERKAGQMPISGEEDLLNKGIAEMLDRLRGSGVDESWWRRFLRSFSDVAGMPLPIFADIPCG